MPVPRRHIELEALSDLGRLQRIHGWGFEDVKMVVEVMAETGAEPVTPWATTFLSPRSAARRAAFTATCASASRR